jgi:hypothetical protein
VYNNSAGGMAALIITIVESMNMNFALKYIVFQEYKNLNTHKYDERLTLLGLVGASLFIFNMIFFFGKEQKVPFAIPNNRLFNMLMLFHVIISVISIL